MARRMPTSRRNRQFGPCPEVPIETLKEPPVDNERYQSGNTDMHDVSEEIGDFTPEEWRFITEDTPSSDGDIYRNETSFGQSDDKVNDIADELNNLLELGAISAEKANLIKTRNVGRFSQGVSGESLTPAVNEIPDFDEEDGMPMNWSKESYDDCVYHLVSLESGDPEFDEIEREFEEAQIEVKKVERLQNGRSLARFKREAEDIEKDRSGDFQLNITYLYHGSDVKKESLCEEGLDQRLSRTGYFGRGIYFSDNPLKCVHYSEDCHQQGSYEAFVLKCRVILGDTKIYAEGENDIDLKREPEKEDPTQGSKYYDSVLGCPKDFNEYVVYENRRAMIEYIITFQADKSVIRDLRQLAKEGPKGKPHKLQGAEGGPREGAEERFSRLSDVREAVRRKRLGQNYVPPSNAQKDKDRAVWSKIQKLQGVKCEQEEHAEDSERELARQPSLEDTPNLMSELDMLHIGSPSSGRPEVFESGARPEMFESRPSPEMFESSYRRSPVVMWDGEQVTEEQDFSSAALYSDEPREDNPVGQVLSVCVAEFLSVTGLEDFSLAKHYIQKAEMNVNNAISLYYEDV